MVVPNLGIEKRFWRLGCRLVAGVDEVGRGCFAGPVCVGAVVFPKDFQLIDGLADSKLLKPRQREQLAVRIKNQALSWTVAEVGVATINKLGIGKATQMAFRKAVRSLNPKPDYILFDAFYNLSTAKISSSALDDEVIASSAYIKHLNRKRQKAVKDGDKICASVAAASIIAKVYRDKLMKKLHRKYPQYGFSKNKGYGTKAHQQAIKKHGLSRLHRKSFNLSKFV